MFIVIFAVAIIIYFLVESNKFSTAKQPNYIAYEDDYQAEIRLKREAKEKVIQETSQKKKETGYKNDVATEAEKAEYKRFCDNISGKVNNTLGEKEREILNIYFITYKERVLNVLKKENKFVSILPTPFEVYLYGASVVFLEDNQHKYEQYKQKTEWDKQHKQYKEANSANQQQKQEQQQPKQKSTTLTKVECFAILKIKADTVPSEKELKTAYRNAIRTCHPDLFVNKSMAEKNEAEQNSRLVNRANDYLTKYFNY